MDVGEATGRIVAWLFIAAVAWIVLRGSATKYLSYLGV